MCDTTQKESGEGQDINAVLDFLQMTREGKLAPIDENVITGVRTEYVLNDCQDEYYYSIS